ncbi:MAG: choice-of-anchor D domain-containing protein, partial [Mycobacterium sp.]
VVGAQQFYSNGPGAAYVFAQNGATWSQQAKLTASNGQAGDWFGTSVAVEAGMALVGAPNHPYSSSTMDPGPGAAYVFMGSGKTWSQQAELSASDAAAGDSFGGSVALSGSIGVVGAPNRTVGSNASQGAAYVFAQSETTWSQQAELTSSDGATGDDFGTSVAISGSTLVAGAWTKTVGSNQDQGAAYVFAQSGTTWSQQAELTASDGAAQDFFGFAVAVSGSTAVVGANGHTVSSNQDQGTAYVFAQSSGVSVSPGSLAFGNQALNNTSAAKMVTLTNPTSSMLDISNIDITPSTNFKISSKTCESTLAAGKSCKVSVEFEPTTVGVLKASLTFTDNAPSSPQTVALSGTGIEPVILSPASENFGKEKVDATSKAKTLTLTNEQNAELTGITISTIGDTGDFLYSTTCGTTLAAKTKCTISVTFKPTEKGTRTAELSVSDNASNSPQKASLTGTGD